jgi:hypothetical protein
VPCSRSSTLLALTSGPERRGYSGTFLLRQGPAKRSPGLNAPEKHGLRGRSLGRRRALSSGGRYDFQGDGLSEQSVRVDREQCVSDGLFEGGPAFAE